MRPPQDRATSSGCGATKTWVMAGRVYRAARRSLRAASRGTRPRRRAARTRTARRSDLAHSSPCRDDEQQLLPATVTDRDHEPAAVGRELLAERRRDRRRRGGDDDPVPRRARRVADAAVADPDVDRAAEPEPGEPLPGEHRQLRLALDRDDRRAEEREDRRLVAGAGPDLEHAVAGAAARAARSSGRPCTAG